ncbi:MAG: hypothetical protein ACFHX7_07840 [Pseudomonadota bacterium]
MRELSSEEILTVSGAFQGTPIPFTNGFVPGANFPGGFPAAIPMVMLSYEIGAGIGAKINDQVEATFGMSTGEAAFLTFKDS